MAKSRLSYIDLAVEDALRGYVLSGRAALLLSGTDNEVLWANADGARLLGASALRPLLDGEATPNAAIMRQIGAAASQLDQRDEAAAMVRARLGFKTQLVALGLTKQTLNNGDTAVLVVSDEMHGRRYEEDDMAQAAVEGLDGFGHASAIIGDGGEIIAASDKFATLDMSTDSLNGLLDEVAQEDDRLIKRMLTTPGGDIAIGLARLADAPARHLLIVADGDGDGELNAAAAPAAPVDRAEVVEDIAEEATTEDEASATPVVGAFSNRRSRTEGMGRWYFKPRKEEIEEGDVEETVETDANSEHETAPTADIEAGTETDSSIVAETEAASESVAPETADKEPTPDSPTEPANDDEDSSSIGAVAAAAATAAAAASVANAAQSSDDGEETAEVKTVKVVHKPTPPIIAASNDDAVEAERSVDETEEAVTAADDVSGDEFDETATDDVQDAGEAVAAVVDEHSEVIASGEQSSADAADERATSDKEVDELEAEAEDEASNEDTSNEAAESTGTTPSVAGDLAADTEDTEGDGFRFASAARPVRFTWAIGSDKVFTAVSKELADTVGPSAGEIDGLEWVAVSDKLGFENGDVIDALLDKGDTWSNRTVLWPVDDTDLRVPVDLAGLPSYGTSREFRGFNGFGIIRTADAVVDDRVAEDTDVEADDDLRELGSDYTPDADDSAKSDDDIASAVTAPIGFLKPFPSDEKTDDEADDTNTDGETGTEAETSTDQETTRSLSSDESSNFRRIGETLSDSVEKAEEVEEEAVTGFVPSAFANRAITEDVAADPEETDAVTDADSETMRSNVDTSILSRLPIPVLVYRDEELLFGNDEFFSTTGYSDLADLEEHGGVEALFADAASRGTSLIRHRDGHDLPMHGNLQSVPWDSEKAMLLTLRHNPPDDGRGGNDGDGDTGGSGPAPSRAERSEPREADRTNIMPFPRLAVRGSDVVQDDDTGSDPRNPLSPEVAARDILSLQVEEARQRMNLRESDEKPERPAATGGASDASPHFTGLEADDLRAILDVSTDGVIIVSNEGIVRDINRSAEALFDVDADAIANRSITRLLVPESHRAALDYLSNMGATGVASLLNDGREVVGKTSQGGLVPLFMTVGQLQHSDDCCAVVRDITHWKKAEEELLTTKAAAEGANELKTQFLAKISHEIRTPLNAIIGFSEMMIEERLGRIDNDRYRGYLRDINRSGSHVLDLVNDLLDITKIEAGKMEMDFDAVDLNRTVSENVAILQGEANADRIIIRTSLSTVVPKVVADQRSMRQIVLNLVSNSIKFTKSGGQVIVSTVYEDTGEVVLRVRDTGVGMTADEIEQSLQPFRQTASSSVSPTKGTGLGLPLTKALVEANRADFHIESTPDEGTLVEIHFPVQRVLADR